MTSLTAGSNLAGQDSAPSAIFDQTSRAWAAGDADAFAAWYANDATVILPGSSCRARRRSAPDPGLFPRFGLPPVLLATAGAQPGRR